MSDSANTVLLIADISGYTAFMKQHAVASSHAKQIIVKLLRAMMRCAKPPLKVAELEGDAVFFFARGNASNVDRLAEQVKAQVVDLFAAFKKELHDIDSLKTCSCDACDHVHNLQLKQVMHVGAVEIERIDRFEKLFGLDVILVHRMLKNSVSANEYVMMTHPTFTRIKDFFGLEPERRKESFEGVGEVETLVFYPTNLQHLQSQAGNGSTSSALAKLLWRVKITVRTIWDLIGLGEYRGTFRNLPA
ncbi:MAG: DUF2652 domain-containing protein [Ignavibacteriae bacterium]|nr:DUF2652 domain-containing protein [Ignavibacteriota bacterium]